MGSQRLYRDTAVMSIGTALSRVTGLVRVAAMTYALGVTSTRLADAYNVANTLPNIVYEMFLGGIFTSVFVPVLVSLRREDRDHSPLLSTSLVALTLVSALALAAAPWIIRLYLFRIPDPETRAATQELATFMFRWFSPQILFYGLSAIAEALLNTRKRFAPPKFVPVLNNVVATATLIAFARFFGEQGVDLSTAAKVVLAAGTTAGVAIQALALLPFLRGEGLRFRPSLSDPAVRTVVRLSGYVLVYVLVNQAGYWLITILAAGVPGGFTAYQVAFQFVLLPHGLFSVSLISALLPDLSSAADTEDWNAYRSGVASGVRGVAYLLMPAAVGYVILARPLTRLIIARGAATARDADVVAGVLIAFSVGIVFFSSFQFLTRCFYALKDTRTPTAVNTVAVVVNSVANVPLFLLLGVPGLALGHGIAYVTGTMLAARSLRQRIPGGAWEPGLASGLARIAVASVGMGAVVWLLGLLPVGDLVRILVGVGGGALVYVAFSQVMGIPERKILLGWVSRSATHGGGSERK